jgi:hypothetical protein
MIMLPLRIDLTAAGAVIVIALSCQGPLHAQLRASERGTVSQTIDGTVIEVDYGRPRLRGRNAFGAKGTGVNGRRGEGGVVHWGEIWTPGANRSTTLRVTGDVKIEGRPLAAGKYSLWIAPVEGRAWTAYLHWESRLYHLQRPDPKDMLLAIPVTPTAGPSTELLTFSFPETRRTGATLLFEWGTTRISLRIDVVPTAPNRPAIAEAEVTPYLGEYDGWIFGEAGDSLPMDTRIFFERGRLKGAITGGRNTFELIPVGQHQFLFEYHDQEGPLDVELDGLVMFTMDAAGRAIGYRMPGLEQPLWMRAQRVR